MYVYKLFIPGKKKNTRLHICILQYNAEPLTYPLNTVPLSTRRFIRESNPYTDSTLQRTSLSDFLANVLTLGFFLSSMLYLNILIAVQCLLHTHTLHPQVASFSLDFPSGFSPQNCQIYGFTNKHKSTFTSSIIFPQNSKIHGFGWHGNIDIHPLRHVYGQNVAAVIYQE